MLINSIIICNNTNIKPMIKTTPKRIINLVSITPLTLAQKRKRTEMINNIKR